MKKLNLKAYVSIAMLGSLAYLLMLIKFPLPIFPNFLTVDFSDIPALVAALLFGPLAALIVEIIKNVLDYLTYGDAASVPIGHLANLMSGLLFVLPTYYIYKRFKTKKGMTFGLILGTITLALLMSVMNYFVFLPAYAALANYNVGDYKTYIISFILPFNIVKGLLVTVLFMLIFIRLQNWLEKQAIVK